MAESSSTIISRSIHPRVWAYGANGKKLNTASKRRRSTVQRAIAGVLRHVAQHPRDAMSRALLRKLEKRLSDAV